MDAGTMAGLGAAFTAGGQGLDEYAQTAFKAQIDAANNAQRVALAKLQQQAQDARTNATIGAANTRQDKALAQTKDLHDQDAAFRASTTKVSQDNAAANLRLRKQEVSNQTRDVNSKIDDRSGKTSGITPEVRMQVQTLTNQARILEDRVNTETRSLSGMLNTSGPEYLKLKETLRQDTAQRDTVSKQLDKLTRTFQQLGPDDDTGIAPSSNPSTPSPGGNQAWEAARNSVPVGGTYTGPDGNTYTRGQ